MYPRNALQAASNPKSHVLRQIEYFYHTAIRRTAWGDRCTMRVTTGAV
jgi:hypothetical protein